jgi:hypothetical protein
MLSLVMLRYVDEALSPFWKWIARTGADRGNPDPCSVLPIAPFPGV